MQHRKLSFLVLTAFSNMGGIEKFNRALIKALHDLSKQLHYDVDFASMYDEQSNSDYVPANLFKAYKGNRFQFVLKSVLQMRTTTDLLLGHLNLALLGVVYKFFYPAKKLVVICHGIEVFQPLSGLKKKVLQQADNIFAVSTYTRQQLIDQNGIDAEKILVFPNTIDPYFQLPAAFSKPVYLKERYGLTENEKVLFTLTRLNSEEGYKGYDKVFKAISRLIKEGHSLKYILAGKADAVESKRIDQLIEELHLQDHVLVTGFVKDEEITDHYLLADLFVMPSKGEGFGIVYLEAMACGLQVIAGNKDGSTEALQFGELGTLIDPDDIDELTKAIEKVLQQNNNPKELQQKMLGYFSFEKFKERLKFHFEEAILN
jgi:glycosyltransferase involved in cell wall biosynthesis